MSNNISFDKQDEYLNLKRVIKDMEKMRNRSEAMTQILQVLESDNTFEEIAAEIVEIIGKFLDVKSVGLCKWNSEGTIVNTMLEWVPDGGKPFAPTILDEIKTKYIRMKQGYIKYEASVCTEYQEELNNTDIKALLVIPAKVNNRQSIYMFCCDDDENRVWDEKTVQFVEDACKILQSVLNKRISRNSIISSYTAIKEILDNVGSGLFVIDKDTKRILFANNTMKRMSDSDMEGSYCKSYGYCGVKHNCVKCDILNEPCAYFETYVHEKQSWYDIKFNDISWVDGKTVSLCNVTDITEKKKIEKRIEFQANNDFLTGLYNRMRCESDMEKFIEIAKESNQSGYVLYLDLDNFKHINDGLGHHYGDMLLKIISLGLQQISGIENSCYRMGGDEFVIIISPENKKELDQITKEITQLFSRPWDLNGTEYYCTMSMGVVSFPEDGNDVNSLVKKADIAMYEAKKTGKNRIVYYKDTGDASSVKRLDMEKNMRSAIAVGGKEFEVYIQPIIDLETNSCTGGEALIRWNSKKLGFISPGDFIPLAEHLGLIVFIGEMFLRQVCMISKEWSDMGINKKIHVNLSIVQLVQNNIVDTIKNIIKETGVNPNNITLEVTESLAINDMNKMKTVIKEIKELGIEIALDDFGTGYSSLNYIKQMDFDIIKVDKIFVDDIVSDDYAQTFIKLITELSERLNAKVCVEGVETKEQLETLKEMKVSMIQGYLFGKPVHYTEYERLFLGINRFSNHIEEEIL